MLDAAYDLSYEAHQAPEPARDMAPILREYRKFRHARIAAHVRTYVDRKPRDENLFARRGTEFAGVLDLTPDNIFA